MVASNSRAGKPLSGLDAEMPRREKRVGAAIERDYRVGRDQVADGADDHLRPQRRAIRLFNAVQQAEPVTHAVLGLC